jgi:hypothetical protein
LDCFHDLWIVWREVFESFERFYCIQTFSESDLSLSEERQYLWIIGPVFLILACVFVFFSLMIELTGEM